MGRRRVVASAWGALVVGLLAHGRAHGGPITLDNGLVGDGHLSIGLDEYGSFGHGLHPALYDQFQPPGAVQDYPTYVSGVMLMIATPDGKRTAVLLSDDTFYDKLEEPNGDGINGDRALARVITTPNTQPTSSSLHGAFAITEPTGPVGASVRLDVTNDQVLSTAGLVSRLEQSYTIKNTGDLVVDLVFDVQWDPDLPWTHPPGMSASTIALDDVVGVGAGRCYLYQHEPGSNVMAIALADGGSEVPISAYFGAKKTITPGLGPPAYGTALDHQVFDNRETPTSWRNNLANVGYNMAGESGTTPGDDAMIGTEYRFSLAVGESHTIKLHRYWGTVALPCAVVPPTCGDGHVDTGEQCDTGGADTASCNGATCTTAVCGDGYINAAAGETCESNGIDSMQCDGATCRAPSCGDGHVNTAAGEVCDTAGVDTADCNGATCTAPACGDGYVNTAIEECEGGSLCDATTCTFAFKLGGGCGGCDSGEPRGAALLALLVGLLVLRRRATGA